MRSDTKDKQEVFEAVQRADIWGKTNAEHFMVVDCFHRWFNALPEAERERAYFDAFHPIVKSKVVDATEHFKTPENERKQILARALGFVDANAQTEKNTHIGSEVVLSVVIAFHRAGVLNDFLSELGELLSKDDDRFNRWYNTGTVALND